MEFLYPLSLRERARVRGSKSAKIHFFKVTKECAFFYFPPPKRKG